MNARVMWRSDLQRSSAKHTSPTTLRRARQPLWRASRALLNTGVATTTHADAALPPPVFLDPPVQGNQRLQLSATRRGFAAMSTTHEAAPSDGTSVRDSHGFDTAHPPTVVFVLGGPGAGKGTQCAKLVADFGFVHLSAGDLLRAHMKSGSAEGQLVADMIAQGQIVPSRVTVGLLLSAMAASGSTKFLIDGFPRNAENRDAWEAVAGFDCAAVLFFDVPQDVMTQRLLGRNQGRTDDNAATIGKRFAVFEKDTRGVLDYYAAKGKLLTVDGSRAVDDVYADTSAQFTQRFR